MNSGKVTGGIVHPCENAYTSTRPTVRRVLFAVIVHDGRGQSGVWRCEAEGDPVWLDILVAEGVAGRGVTLTYELASREFKRADVRLGDWRFLRVSAVEFGPRPGGEGVVAGVEDENNSDVGPAGTGATQQEK
jgi:hypothetical protein